MGRRRPVSHAAPALVQLVHSARTLLFAERGEVEMKEIRKMSAASWMPMALLVASVSVNALQAKKIFDLMEPSRPVRSHVGEVVQPIEVRDADGGDISVALDRGTPTLVYFFSPACAWCERNWANIQAIADAADGRYRVVAVTSEADLSAFSQKHPLKNVQVFGGLSQESHDKLGFTGTPHTLVVSAQGIVSHEWAGAFQGASVRQLEELFNVVLPGLSPVPGK